MGAMLEHAMSYAYTLGSPPVVDATRCSISSTIKLIQHLMQLLQLH